MHKDGEEMLRILWRRSNKFCWCSSLGTACRYKARVGDLRPGRFVALHLWKGLASRRCKSFSSIFLKPRLPRNFWPGVGVGSIATRLAGRMHGVTDVRPGAPEGFVGFGALPRGTSSQNSSKRRVLRDQTRLFVTARHGEVACATGLPLPRGVTYLQAVFRHLAGPYSDPRLSSAQYSRSCF
jgi:hypothetical protein